MAKKQDEELPPWKTGEEIVVIVDADDEVRKPKVIASDFVPPAALRWADGRERSLALRAWRRAVMYGVGSQARALKVGWLLEGLVATKGFSEATDQFIGGMTDLGIASVQKALVSLDTEGLIFRGQILVRRGVFKRRIFPTMEASQHGGVYSETEHPPTTPFWRKTILRSGVPHIETTAPQRGSRKGSPAEAARLEAERRDARERGEKLPGWLDD